MFAIIHACNNILREPLWHDRNLQNSFRPLMCFGMYTQIFLTVGPKDMKHVFSGFPVTVEQPVQWAEMDMHNHVNNVWFFRYIENARIAYYEKIQKYEFEKRTGISFILASATCQYLSPLIYPDTVIAGARTKTIENDRAILEYRLVSSKHQRLAAIAETTIVSYNFTENKKALFPDELKKRMSQLENKSF